MDVRGARGVWRLSTWWLAVLLAIGLSTPSPDAAAGKAKLSSEWRAQPIAVDGVNQEWPVLTTVSKDARLSMAARNDERYLYLALVTSESTTALQALNEGLTLWFDVEGGTRKRFGLAYPLPRGAGGPPRGGPEGQDRSGGRGEPPPDAGRRGREGEPTGPAGTPPDAEAVWKQALGDGRLRQAELVGPGRDDRQILMLDVQPAIQARIGWAEGMMVLELAIPIAKTASGPAGLAISPGAIVGIGIETPERNVSMNGPGGGGMGGRGGGMGGRGGGAGAPGGMGGFGAPGGGPGLQRGGPFGAQVKPLKVWTTLQLATQPRGPIS